MAFQLQLRHDTAANWISTNPVLAQGEIAVITDSLQFRIGNGTSAFNSLSNQGATGPTQTMPYRSFGDGSDLNVNITSGVTTLTRDMFYNNLTISGTGSIFTNNFKIFVKGVLDLTAAPVGAINNNGIAGGNASGATGGTVTAAAVAGTVGASGGGTAGANGTTTTGAASAGVAGVTGGGGQSNTGGGGGTNGTNAGGAGGGGATPTAAAFRTFATNFLRGATLMAGGCGGRGGASGGGDGTNSGMGGGGGGNGGGFVALYANIIIKSANTPSGAIQANGAAGGAGAMGATGVVGGGGGGAGGGGGWVYIAHNVLAGPIVNNLIQVYGGGGGNGGAGFGAGAIGGTGGNGGYGGRVTIFDVTAQTGAEYQSVTSAIFAPEVTTGNTTTTSAAGAGCPGELFGAAL